MKKGRMSPTTQTKLEGREEEILSLYEAGVSSLILSQKFKVSPATIRKLIRDNGATVRGKGRIPTTTLSEKDLLDMVWLYQTGVSCAELADKFKAPIDTVRNAIRQGGITLIKGKIASPDTVAQRMAMLQMHQAGYSLRQISELFGMKYNTVYVTLRRLNAFSVDRHLEKC